MTFAISCHSTPARYDLILVVALSLICLFLIIPTSAALGAVVRVGIVAGALSRKSEAISRGARMLRTALGPAIAAWLEEPAVVEVMLNPDGRLWVDRLTEGLKDTGERLSAGDGERIVRLVAHHVGAEVHPASPRVSAELPETGERFEGLLPPVVAAPAFAIRKPAIAVFTLDDYVAAKIITTNQAAILRSAVAQRRNILVAGGTSTGKTTLVNALLAEVAKTADRVVLIEDARELQCKAPNLVALRTKDGVISLSDLVRSSLRLRPDRIPIGEVRGAEALDLLKAWGTGHPGGIGTIHAGSALGALRRLEQLIQEAVVTVPRALIAETINVIAVLSGRGSQRRLAELARVEGLRRSGDYDLVAAVDLASAGASA
jgi:type IV secretion system protein TrbB